MTKSGVGVGANPNTMKREVLKRFELLDESIGPVFEFCLEGGRVNAICEKHNMHLLPFSSPLLRKGQGKLDGLSDVGPAAWLDVHTN